MDWRHPMAAGIGPMLSAWPGTSKTVKVPPMAATPPWAEADWLSMNTTKLKGSEQEEKCTVI